MAGKKSENVPSTTNYEALLMLTKTSEIDNFLITVEKKPYQLLRESPRSDDYSYSFTKKLKNYYWLCKKVKVLPHPLPRQVPN